jgi:hypothetical protein
MFHIVITKIMTKTNIVIEKKVIHYYFSHYLLFIIFFSTICCGYFFIENVQKCGSFDQILLFSYNLTQNIKIYPTAVFNNGIKDIPAHEFEDRAAFTPPPLTATINPPIVNWPLVDLLLY